MNITKQDIINLAEKIEEDRDKFRNTFLNLEDDNDPALADATLEELTEYGLTETEAQVILFAVSEGNNTLSEVAHFLFWEAK